MAEKKVVKRSTSRKPSDGKKKPPPPETIIRHMNVFTVPVTTIDVSARCSHGCFVMTPNSATVWYFNGIAEGVDAGPGCTQIDILIHRSDGDDPDHEGCIEDCWGGDGDD